MKMKREPIVVNVKEPENDLRKENIKLRPY
jgi:hypothetical protein